jgi:hypothetical protein
MSDTPYEGWALIEQMGFRKTVAKVREVEQFGTKMLRMDVPFFDGDKPEPAGYATRFAGGPSLYQVSPLEDELALHMARQQSDPRPVKPTSFRIEDQRPLPFGAPPGERPEEGDDDPFAGEDEDR